MFEVGEEGLPVMELATTLAVTPSEVVKILFMKGIMVQVNQVRTAPDDSMLCSPHDVIFVHPQLQYTTAIQCVAIG